MIQDYGMEYILVLFCYLMNKNKNIIICRLVSYILFRDKSLIPAGKISTLSQGMFVGTVEDNFGETIDQKIFHAQIVVDNDTVQRETTAYQSIPEISSFLDENGNDTMEQQIQANYR